MITGVGYGRKTSPGTCYPPGVPLKAYPAVRTRDVPSVHLLQADCVKRLCYAKHGPVHGAVDNAAIVKGYEYGPGRHDIAQPDELDQLRPVKDKSLRLEHFLARRSVVGADGLLELTLLPQVATLFVALPGCFWEFGRFAREGLPAGEQFQTQCQACDPKLASGPHDTPLSKGWEDRPGRQARRASRRTCRHVRGQVLLRSRERGRCLKDSANRKSIEFFCCVGCLRLLQASAQGSARTSWQISGGASQR
jgi:hypothetical protein